jgi:diguanylate cyclase (GGDEF)-like protein
MIMEEEYLLKTLFEMFPFGVYVVDIETYEIIYANRSYQIAHGDCVGKICHHAIYQEDSPCHHCKIGQLVDKQGNPNNNTLIFEHFNECNDYWYQHHEKVLRCTDGRTIKYTIEVDICELKAIQNRLAESHALLTIKNRELLEINRHDELTKVFNRSHLNHVLAERLYNAERYQKAFSVVLIDIDDFKKINDNYGHLVGDAVLIEMAQLINHNIRQSDCFGRWGGEEFMIIAPYIKSLSDTKAFIEKLCKQIAKTSFSVVGHCTCSFGIAHCTPQDTMISIVKNADDALYFAKAHGKNQVIIYDELKPK